MTDADHPDSLGDTAQVNRIVRQVVSSYREIENATPDVHPLVKWVVGAVAALGMAAIIGGGTWLVASVGEMRETLARVDERMKGQDSAQISRDNEQDRRIIMLESYHKSMGSR